MLVFVKQEKITVRIGFQSDPIDWTKTRLMKVVNLSHLLHLPGEQAQFVFQL